MRTGDLVWLRPHNRDPLDVDEDYIGLVVKSEYVGTDKSGTFLYDILLNETNEVITISDIYFEIWRIE